MTTTPSILSCALTATVLLWASVSSAQPAQTTVNLILKDHRFTPATVTVPAGRPVRIELNNQDGTAEEFDSDDLHAEKEVAPHAKVVIQVAPLKPGTYNFTGELHAKTAAGRLIAEAPQ